MPRAILLWHYLCKNAHLASGGGQVFFSSRKMTFVDDLHSYYEYFVIRKRCGAPGPTGFLEYFTSTKTVKLQYDDKGAVVVVVFLFFEARFFEILRHQKIPKVCARRRRTPHARPRADIVRQSRRAAPKHTFSLTMSHMWLVQLPPSLDDGTRVDDASQTAGLRGGVVTEKPLSALGNSRLDCARLDPDDRRHAAAVERSGVLRSMRVGGRNGSGVERYQLHTESEDGALQAVSRPWRQFEFIPRQKQLGAIVFAQLGSPNLLYTNIPVDGGESGSMVFLFGSHNAPVSALDVDELGTTVVSGAEDGSLSVWHVSDGKKVGSISVAHEGGVLAVAVASPTCVISAGADGSVRVWQVSADPRLRMLHRMNTGPAPLTSLAVWGAESGKGKDRPPEAPLGKLGASVLKGVSLTEGHQSGSGGAGELLAAGSADGTVYTWTADPSFANLNDFGWRPASVSHHLQGLEVSALSFRADGKALVAGGSEPHHEGKGEVRLFETEHWTSVATQSYSSGVVACKYTRSALLVDLMIVCSGAGAPKLLEAKLTPCVTAPLREKGMGTEVPPQPLGHGPLPPAGNADGSGIRIVDPTPPLGMMEAGDATPRKGDAAAAAAAADEPRAAPPPTPSAKSPGPAVRQSSSVRGEGIASQRGPKPVLRSAFSRSGKHHTEPDATPGERATRVVAKMAAKVMAKAPALVPETLPTENDDEAMEDNDDVLVGVKGADTELAKPSLMSSRPLLHRNSLIPFAIFDKEAELEHHMAPLGVSGRKEAAAVADTHVRAMAAANMDLSLPRNARRFERLTQIPKQAPKSAKRLVGKQLDPRWLAVRDIKPRMEDMWVAARREPQVCSTEGWNASALLLPPAEGVEF